MYSNLFPLYFLVLIISTMSASSCNSWFPLWVSLEINMMAFIPLILNNFNFSYKSSMKYFIIQSFASSLFLLSMNLSIFSMNSPFFFEMTTLAILTKMGMFPFFFWFPDLSEQMSWASFMILSTWQKIIPLFIMTSVQSMIMSWSIFMSAIIGSVGLMNITSIQKMLAFSSINNMAWMMMSILNKNQNWILFLFIYSGIMIFLCLNFKFSNISNLTQTLTPLSFNSKFSIIIGMLSLGGLPPLLGFFPKLLIILTSENMLFLVFTLALSSLTSVFIYLRVFYSALFMKKMTFYKPEKISLGGMGEIFLKINLLSLMPLLPMMMV